MSKYNQTGGSVINKSVINQGTSLNVCRNHVTIKLNNVKQPSLSSKRDSDS